MRYLLLMLFSFGLHAQTLDDCQFAFTKLGDGSGMDQVSTACKDYVANNANANAKASIKTEDRDREYFAYKNAILSHYKTTDKRYLTSGSNTLLENAIALHYDHINKEIYIIDQKSSRVLVFLSEIPGNVAPVRVLEKEELVGASDLTVMADTLYVLNSITNKVLVYNRLASVKARDDKQYLEIVQSVDVPLSAVSIEALDGSLVLKDQDGNQLSTLKLE